MRILPLTDTLGSTGASLIAPETPTESIGSGASRRASQTDPGISTGSLCEMLPSTTGTDSGSGPTAASW